MATLVLAACGTDAAAPADRDDVGARVFAANCATCHGPDLGGTDRGPPLLHEYYLPDHHPDVVFATAIANGVQAHHWDFGPMPAIGGLSDDEVAAVVAHVRDEQRRAGLME
ncbi:c-type cytochrome [Salsipaludibacter albus]|uniref:c-type cytochrome n=1 Tax=Salsipaludibacter albus TaxID=2849650 RepID=UPI001EE3AA02